MPSGRPHLRSVNPLPAAPPAAPHRASRRSKPPPPLSSSLWQGLPHGSPPVAAAAVEVPSPGSAGGRFGAFAFDHLVPPGQGTESLYRGGGAQAVVLAACDGFHGSICAYGQVWPRGVGGAWVHLCG